MPEDLGVAEAAAEIGVDRRTISRWIAAGRLPTTAGQDGRSRRIPRAELLAFLARHRVREHFERAPEASR